MYPVGDRSILYLIPPISFLLIQKNLSRPSLYITLIVLFQSPIVYILIARENRTLTNS